MVATVKQWTRIEIALQPGGGYGMQGSYLPGIMVEGAFIATGAERTTGVNAGANPEYEDQATDVLGATVTANLTSNADLTAERDALQASLTAAQEALATMTADRDAKVAALAAAQAQAATLTTQLADAQAEAADLTASLEAARGVNSALAEQVTALQATIATLQDALAACEAQLPPPPDDQPQA